MFSSCSPQAAIDLVKCQMLIHLILIIDRTGLDIPTQCVGSVGYQVLVSSQSVLGETALSSDQLGGHL